MGAWQQIYLQSETVATRAWGRKWRRFSALCQSEPTARVPADQHCGGKTAATRHWKFFWKWRCLRHKSGSWTGDGDGETFWRSEWLADHENEVYLASQSRNQRRRTPNRHALRNYRVGSAIAPNSDRGRRALQHSGPKIAPQIAQKIWRTEQACGLGKWRATGRRYCKCRTRQRNHILPHIYGSVYANNGWVRGDRSNSRFIRGGDTA